MHIMLHIWLLYITYERGDTRALSLSNQGLVGLVRRSIFSYQNKIKNTLVLLYESLYSFFLVCYFKIIHSFSLRKQPTFHDATTGFPTNSSTREIPRMTRHYADLGNASDWLKQIFTSIRWETSGSFAKC